MYKARLEVTAKQKAQWSKYFYGAINGVTKITKEFTYEMMNTETPAHGITFTFHSKKFDNMAQVDVHISKYYFAPVNNTLNSCSAIFNISDATIEVFFYVGANKHIKGGLLVSIWNNSVDFEEDAEPIETIEVAECCIEKVYE